HKHKVMGNDRAAPVGPVIRGPRSPRLRVAQRHADARDLVIRQSNQPALERLDNNLDLVRVETRLLQAAANRSDYLLHELRVRLDGSGPGGCIRRADGFAEVVDGPEHALKVQ